MFFAAAVATVICCCRSYSCSPRMLKACVMFSSQWWLLGGQSRRVLYALLLLLLPGSPANSRKLANGHSSREAAEGIQSSKDRHKDRAMLGRLGSPWKTYCDMRCNRGFSGLFLSTGARAVCRGPHSCSMLLLLQTCTSCCPYCPGSMQLV